MRAFLSGAIVMSMSFLILASHAAQGGVIEIRPTTLIISPSQRVGILSLENPEAAPSVYQISIYSWHQKGEEQILEPSHDMIASPPIVSLPGNGSQIVRVGLRSGDLPAQEQTYRLILEEIPTVDPFRKPGLNIALRLSLPLFVRPQADIPPAKLDADVKLANGNAIVTIHNQGHFAARMTQAILNAKALGDRDGLVADHLTYVLPGGWATYSFALPASVTALPDATVTLQTEEGLVDLPAPVVAEAMVQCANTDAALITYSWESLWAVCYRTKLMARSF